MLKKFKSFLFDAHYTFTKKELEAMLLEIEKELKTDLRKEYEAEYKNKLIELQNNVLTKSNYIFTIEKDLTNLVIDNDIMKSQVKELQDEKRIEKAKNKKENSLLKDIFPEIEKWTLPSLE